MKKRAIILLFAVALLFGGCAGLFEVRTEGGTVGYYNNSVTVINSATTDNNELKVLVNGRTVRKIYNVSDPTPERPDATTVALWEGISNVQVPRSFDVQVIGKKNGRTVAAHLPFYATSWGENHQTWIVTDQMLQPYYGF